MEKGYNYKSSKSRSFGDGGCVLYPDCIIVSQVYPGVNIHRTIPKKKKMSILIHVHLKNHLNFTSGLGENRQLLF